MKPAFHQVMETTRLMLRRFQISFFLLASFCLLTAAYGSDVGRFAGQWRGAVIETSDGVDIAAEDMLLNLAPTDDGFELEWNAPGGGTERVRFVKTKDQPGVFSTRASKGGLLGFLSSGELNPLAGDPLTWARLDGDTLVVYKLVIDDLGGFTLDRYERMLQDGMLWLHFTRRAHGEPQRSLVARLERVENAQ